MQGVQMCVSVQKSSRDPAPASPLPHAPARGPRGASPGTRTLIPSYLLQLQGQHLSPAPGGSGYPLPAGPRPRRQLPGLGADTRSPGGRDSEGGDGWLPSARGPGGKTPSLCPPWPADVSAGVSFPQPRTSGLRVGSSSQEGPSCPPCHLRPAPSSTSLPPCLRLGAPLPSPEKLPGRRRPVRSLLRAPSRPRDLRVPPLPVAALSRAVSAAQQPARPQRCLLTESSRPPAPGLAQPLCPPARGVRKPHAPGGPHSRPCLYRDPLHRVTLPPA